MEGSRDINEMNLISQELKDLLSGKKEDKKN